MPLVNEPASVSPPTTVQDLLTVWQFRADRLRELAHESEARHLEECIQELKAIHWQEREKPLTVTQAAELSGYSADHLYTLIRKGELRNVGEKNRPRVCRADLPRKPNAAEDRYQRESDIYSEPI